MVGMSTRSDILTHAEDLARRTGYDGFSFADLAAGAGIRKASVHHHFPTKPALAAELMATYSARVFAALDRVASHSAGARLTAVLDLYRAALEGGRSQCLCVAFSAIQARLPAPVQAELLAFQTDMRRRLAQMFEDGAEDGSVRSALDAQTEAAAAFALLEGAQLIARASRDPAQFDLATAPLRACIISGEQS